MPVVDVYNFAHEKTDTVDLPEGVFGAEVKPHLIHAVVRYQLAKRRAGTHKVKTRAEVAGGGRKPHKQKGTGRARAGTTRAAQWRGGGVVFGPKPRSYAFDINKKERAQALRGALSTRVADGTAFVLESLDLTEIKTKSVVDFMTRFELTDALIVMDSIDEVVTKSTRNLKNVTVINSAGINVYDILKKNNLVMTKGAVAALSERLGS